MGISFHPRAFDKDSPPHESLFATGFREVDVEDFARLAKYAENFVWSPIVWQGGERKKANFLYADFCALDFDTGELTLEQAKLNYSDMEHLIGPSLNHQREKGGKTCDRFRVVMRFEKRITDLRTYHWNMREIVAKQECDMACTDGGRFYKPCRSIAQVVVGPDLYRVAVDENVPDSFEPHDLPRNVLRRAVLNDAYRKAGIPPKWAVTQLRSLIPVGKRNDTIHRIAKDLIRAGFEPGQVYDEIVRSETYKTMKIGLDLQKEIEDTITSAANAIAAEAKMIEKLRNDRGNK